MSARRHFNATAKLGQRHTFEDENFSSIYGLEQACRNFGTPPVEQSQSGGEPPHSKVDLKCYLNCRFRASSVMEALL